MCGVKMFCSSRANHLSAQARKHEKLDKFTLNMLCQFLFSLKLTFRREKLFFRKHLYCKTKTDYTYIKLRVQNFATGKSFSFNQ